MINDVINSIIEAEGKAEELLHEAQTKSKEILLSAEADKLVIIKSSREETKQKVKAIFEAGERAADVAADDVIKKGNAQAVALFDEGMKKSMEARNYIVRRIISKYGTR